MTVPRKLQGLRYLPLCLLLLSAGALAEVRDVRMHGPNGDGGDCSEADAATPADDPAPAGAKPAATAAKPAGAARIKPVMTVRGSDAGSSHAPRWHSFLPGMFR